MSADNPPVPPPPMPGSEVLFPAPPMAGHAASVKPKTSMRGLFALVALGAGAVVAILLTGRTVGLGFALFAIAVCVSVILLTRPIHNFNTLVFGSLAILLYAMSAVRSAPWLVALDILAATLLLPLALVDASTFRGLGRTISSWLYRVFWALGPVARGLAKLRPERRTSGISMLRGVLIAVVPLIVFGLLFASADRAFSDLMSSVIPDLEIDDLRIRTFLGLLATTIVAAFFLTATATPKAESSKAGSRKKLKPVEWITALVLIDLLFAVFVGVQLTVFFGGDHHVLETAGLTYAQYAREGFYQLLAVSALVLGLIAAVAWWADYGSKREQVLFRCLLGALALLTGVVLVSALVRVSGLESSFGLTLIRLGGHAVMFWIAGLLLIVVAAGWKLDSSWLPRVLIGYSALALLAFTLINPEGIIARYNIDRFERTGSIDDYYLSQLSSDAMPEVSRLPSSIADCSIGEVPGSDSLLSANVSRTNARSAAEQASLNPNLCSPDWRNNGRSSE